MARVYARMVRRGLIALGQVPARYREAVEVMLKGEGDD